MKVIVLRAEDGRIEEDTIREGELATIVKEVVAEALGRWDPRSSDFTAIRSSLEMRYKLPISPDLYDKIAELGLEKYLESGELVVKIPTYIISYRNEWREDSYRDRGLYAVAPELSSDVHEQLKQYVVEATSIEKKLEEQTMLAITEEELQRLEEGIEDEEEKPKKRRRTRKSRRKTG